MDGQEYLTQISADVRPMAGPSGLAKIIHSKFFIVGLVGVVALVFIIILGLVLGGGGNSEKTKTIALELHIKNTAAIVKDYQPYVKSSKLRSSCASLQSVLLNTDKQLTDYIAGKYTTSDDKKKKEPSKAETDAENAKAKLNNELFEAKINGILDRTMAHKMTYEISILMNEETTLYNATKNETLRAIIDESYDSLETLYDGFNNFTEGR